MEIDSTDVGEQVRNPSWDEVAKHLECARHLFPSGKPLFLPGLQEPDAEDARLHSAVTVGKFGLDKPLLQKGGTHLDPDYYRAHQVLCGYARREGEVDPERQDVYTQASNHINWATRYALAIVLHSFGSSAHDTENNPFPWDTDFAQSYNRQCLLDTELRLVHRYSELLGLCDPSGQLMEIFEIARRRCCLPGTDPVLRNVNEMASGFRLDFNVDDPHVTRIKRSLRDSRITAEQMESASQQAM